jgi:hypothetical protein
MHYSHHFLEFGFSLQQVDSIFITSFTHLLHSMQFSGQATAFLPYQYFYQKFLQSKIHGNQEPSISIVMSSEIHFFPIFQDPHELKYLKFWCWHKLVCYCSGFHWILTFNSYSFAIRHLHISKIYTIELRNLELIHLRIKIKHNRYFSQFIIQTIELHRFIK